MYHPKLSFVVYSKQLRVIAVLEINEENKYTPIDCKIVGRKDNLDWMDYEDLQVIKAAGINYDDSENEK